ncbi:MAG: hypothetical protein WD065_03370 [Planctomycetaceae bacterium]
MLKALFHVHPLDLQFHAQAFVGVVCGVSGGQIVQSTIKSFSFLNQFPFRLFLLHNAQQQRFERIGRDGSRFFG